MSSLVLGRITLFLTALAPLASAQTFQFQLLATQGSNAAIIQNNSILGLNSLVGQPATIQVKATYTGLGSVLIPTQPIIIGSTAFSASLAATPPVTLAPNGSISFTIQYQPATAALSSAQMSLLFVETLPPSVAGGNPTTTTSAINLSLQGTAPSFVLSYILQANQNVVPLQAGGTIVFPSTPIPTTAQAAFDITNTGSGAGTVTNITITGNAFSITGRPLFPQTIGAGLTLPVTVLYQPTAVGTDTGQIQVTFSTGSPVTVNLSGSGTAPSFTYSILSTTPPTAFSPGGTISFPNTLVGQSSTMTIRVLNSGNANGSVSSINIAGQGFSVSNVPVLVDVLAPNASLTFNITFTPTQPIAQTGTLIVNSDTFALSGTGLGALLVFSYVAGGSTITLGAGNNSVVFSPVMVSQSEQLIFDVKNTGTLSATISNINVGSGPYVVSGLPSLPVTLAPNSDFQITIKFTPTTVGPANGTLLLDATTIALIGSGTAPPPLPAYTIAGPSGNTAPMTQPTVGLTLASAYPVAITGVLTMSISGTLPADAAVQFATGGRTVSFTIPANQTSAVFGTQGTQLGLQTGTVASNITLTPSFATQAGNVDITPTSPSSLQFAVAPAVPSLIAMQLGGLSATGFTIQVTGFSTPRSLKSMAVQFTTAPGFSMPTTQFTIDVSQVSAVWYDGTASQAFGSLFTISVPFTFQGTVPTGQSILNAITSVSVTMSNALGVSNSLQAAVP